MATTVEDMSVDRGRFQAGVTEQLLDGADIVAVLEQMRSERVAEGMTACTFHDFREPDGFRDGTLHDRLVDMMSVSPARFGIGVVPSRREHELPAQVPTCAGRFPGHGARQRRPAGATAEVILVLLADAFDLPADITTQQEGKHGEPVVPAFRAADGDPVLIQENVLDTKLQRLKEAKTGSVQQAGNEVRQSAQLRKHGRDLLARQHYREAPRLAWACDTLRRRDRNTEDLAVEKEQRAGSLVLCRRADSSRDREMRQNETTASSPRSAGCCLP
jgi:hypothetical protein